MLCRWLDGACRDVDRHLCSRRGDDLPCPYKSDFLMLLGQSTRLSNRFACALTAVCLRLPTYPQHILRLPSYLSFRLPRPSGQVYRRVEITVQLRLSRCTDAFGADRWTNPGTKARARTKLSSVPASIPCMRSADAPLALGHVHFVSMFSTCYGLSPPPRAPAHYT
ncbi:hypothetical protein BD626DRAFT_18380 [Schizophyllum amplum]|uniref:Uncharacterized protein n=1 Tax=Schizophyllum amplum TaxID=97359 RepID=A0A550CYA4_9AGAR|nr:hypothetical protein BD626DRAFT_18380 [Auriculariopsis ampla]